MTGYDPRLLIVCVAAATAMVACSEGAGDVEPTYHGTVESIVNDNCSSCHYPGEGAPIDFHTYEDVADNAQLALGYMDNGQMPPWTPDSDCREYKDQRVMAQEDIETFRQWIENGTPRGEVPEDYEEYEPPRLPEADLRIGFEGAPYEPDPELDDEYRCFQLEKEFDEDVYADGIHVDTGGKEVIHHANIFLASPHVVGGVEELEQSAEGPGYPCFGGPGFDNIDLIGSWVPGVQPIFAPEDSAILIPEGSRLVMQIHFNTLFADAEPVDPEVMLYTRDEIPDYRVYAMPFAILDFVVPPGERESKHTREFTNRSDESWTVLGAAPHMHMLGERVHSEVVHEDGSTSCLVDIPDWDFDWQQEYRFYDDEWIEVEPGESVRLTCEFDNSPQNQPVIDGEQQQPQQVTWGPNTTDEMCLNFLVVQEPYEPTDSTELCGEFESCRTDCDEPSSMSCLLNCGSNDTDCGFCLLAELQDCGEQFCPDELDGMQGCLINCGQEALAGGDIEACFDEECPDESSALEECIEPRIAGGYCNEQLDACNVEY